MKIFLYDTETLEKIKNYEADFVPSVGDYFMGPDIGTPSSGMVCERIIHLLTPDVITLRIKMTKI